VVTAISSHANATSKSPDGRAWCRKTTLHDRVCSALDGLTRPDDRGEQQRTLLLLDVREHRERGPVTALQCVQLGRRQLCEVGQHDPERERSQFTRRV
jgi:hypothetical protein